MTAQAEEEDYSKWIDNPEFKETDIGSAKTEQ